MKELVIILLEVVRPKMHFAAVHEPASGMHRNKKHLYSITSSARALAAPRDGTRARSGPHREGEES
jgi:hypothetical protein